MRKFVGVISLISISLLGFSTISQAATKVITVKPMSAIATLPSNQSITGAVSQGKTIYVYGTIPTEAGADAFLSAIDESGVTRWLLPVHEGEFNIASSAAIDTLGNIYLFGASSNPTIIPPTQVTSSSVLNPDSVTVDVEVPQRNDISEIVVWKISPDGQLLSTLVNDMNVPVLVGSGAVSPTGIAVVGSVQTTTGKAGFFTSVSSDGVFSKVQYIGKSDTEINAIAKKTDGSYVIVGASSETISGKTLNGSRDGLIISITAKGKITSVVRSSNQGAFRNWLSASNSLFLGGESLTGKKREAVMTTFNAKIVPTWTTRFLAKSPALITDISPTSRGAFFISTSAIPGLTGWKASKGVGLALIFGANGFITGAYSATGVANPIAFTYSKELGLVVVGSGPKGVSVFHVLTR